MKQIREAATSALYMLLETRELRPGQVTTCLVDDLNANLRYMGTQSGVVDLHTGALLPPDQGRKALVTEMAPVEYVPGATDPDVDRLFAHLPKEAQSWWRLGTRPARRTLLRHCLPRHSHLDCRATPIPKAAIYSKLQSEHAIMLTVAVLSQKGGSGKSTVAIGLAVAHELAGGVAAVIGLMRGVCRCRTLRVQ